MKKAAILKLILVLLVLSRPAMAYIDPGSGSMILQVILAGILGSLFAIKASWQKTTAFFRGLTGKRNLSSSNER